MENHQLSLRIRAFRKLKGYTQDELAKLLGVSIAALGAIERGARNPDPRILDKIAKVLDIDIEELNPKER